MNSNIIHPEMMNNDTPGFDDDTNDIKWNLDVIQMIALLDRCI